MKQNTWWLMDENFRENCRTLAHTMKIELSWTKNPDARLSSRPNSLRYCPVVGNFTLKVKQRRRIIFLLEQSMFENENYDIDIRNDGRKIDNGINKRSKRTILSSVMRKTLNCFYTIIKHKHHMLQKLTDILKKL